MKQWSEMTTVDKVAAAYDMRIVIPKPNKLQFILDMLNVKKWIWRWETARDVNKLEYENDKFEEETTTKVDFSYNCLTQGIHHGRQEELFTMEMAQVRKKAAELIENSGTDYSVDELIAQWVVIAIAHDAAQYLQHGVEPRPSQEWFENVVKLAHKKVPEAMERQKKVLFEVYSSGPEACEQPHPYDCLNYLTRTVGVSCSIEAAKLERAQGRSRDMIGPIEPGDDDPGDDEQDDDDVEIY